MPYEETTPTPADVAAQLPAAGSGPASGTSEASASPVDVGYDPVQLRPVDRATAIGHDDKKVSLDESLKRLSYDVDTADAKYDRAVKATIEFMGGKFGKTMDEAGKYGKDGGAGGTGSDGTTTGSDGTVGSGVGGRPSFIPADDWKVVLKHCDGVNVDPYLIAAIGYQETHWGKLGLGRKGYTLGMGATESGNVSYLSGLESQIKEVADRLRALKDCAGHMLGQDLKTIKSPWTGHSDSSGASEGPADLVWIQTGAKPGGALAGHGIAGHRPWSKQNGVYGYHTGDLKAWYTNVKAKFLELQSLRGAGATPAAGGTATTIGQAIVDLAMTKKGTAYLWGGAGPDRFDCSGLVLWCYMKIAKVSLPHFTGAQVKLGRLVDKKDLIPGDAIYFSSNGSHSGVHHTGLYIGDGKMIHAPKTGDVIKISDALTGYHGRQYYQARRFYTDAQSTEYTKKHGASPYRGARQD